ncbi:PREDICTED: early nodulin-like protein 2 [Fragaria vesca subsp. vesca]|uniref:early nodulin-like protein 2 n=1 Tax=Fragaria vesca subsp. vesca TaxID=101020 RepID=UPI0002C32EDE|nr:PREDICTED: early nodulin-like protein 2 [Fragaria vesca subsp. vesca]
MASISYTTQGFILLLAAASLFAVSEAKTIVVGGSEGWRFGFNYTEWVLQNSPFYINDELLFKYDPPSEKNSGYSVYLLPNLWSYISCDFSKAKILAGPNQGAGKGFKVELNQWRPYYFASGDKNGYNCKDGLMKLFAVPLPHWNN